MIGYLLAILSSLFFGIYIIPKKIVKLDTKHYLFYMSLGFVAISLIAYLISLLTGNNNEPLFHPVLLLVCLRGLSWFVASNLFLISIDKIGMSRSTQYKNLKGPFGVLLTLIFLSEFKVTNVSLVLLAALLTFLSALLFTIKKDENKKIDKSGIIYACIASLFLSVNALIQKYVTNCGFVYMQQLYQSITILIASYIYVLIKDKTVKKLQIISFKNKILSFLGGVLYYFATYFNTLSYKTLPASISFTIINMSGLWSVLIGILIFKEIDFKKNYKRIILGIILLILSIFALLFGKN